MRKKRRSKTLRQKLVKAADDAIKAYKLKKYPRCVICGSINNLQPGHLITRGNYSTRWDDMNVFTQCRNCNYTHEYHPEIFTSWFIERFGLEQYQLLVKRSNTPVKFSNDDLRLIAEHYENKLKELEEA